MGGSDWSNLSRSARADTQPGRVQNIRMTGRDDGQITIAWDKPSDQHLEDPRLHGHVAGGGPRSSPAAPRRSPRRGWTTTSSTPSPSRRRTRWATRCRGPPRRCSPRHAARAGAPAVTDLESGANQTSIRVAWQGVLAGGPGPTVYTVSYTNGVTAGTVPGCQRLASLTCTHAGVPYDGLTYTYTVVAANQPGDQPGSARSRARARSIEAVGRPAAWGRVRRLPHGQQPGGGGPTPCPTRAATSARSDILVAGGGALHPAADRHGQHPAVPTPSNEQPYAVQLRVQRGRPGGMHPERWQNVQSYGRLDGGTRSIRRSSTASRSSGSSRAPATATRRGCHQVNESAATGIRCSARVGRGAFASPRRRSPHRGLRPRSTEIFVT